MCLPSFVSVPLATLTDARAYDACAIHLVVFYSIISVCADLCVDRTSPRPVCRQCFHQHQVFISVKGTKRDLLPTSMHLNGTFTTQCITALSPLRSTSSAAPSTVQIKYSYFACATQALLGNCKKEDVDSYCFALYYVSVTLVMKWLSLSDQSKGPRGQEDQSKARNLSTAGTLAGQNPAPIEQSTI